MPARSQPNEQFAFQSAAATTLSTVQRPDRGDIGDDRPRTATLEDNGAGDDYVGVRATFAVISGFGAPINFKPDWSIADHFADLADFFHLAFNERLSAES